MHSCPEINSLLLLERFDGGAHLWSIRHKIQQNFWVQLIIINEL